MSERMFETEIWTIARMADGTALLLRPINSNLAVPIFIGENEAQSILLGLSGTTMSRPFTHDLFLDLVKKDSLALSRVEIHDLRDNIFYARLILTGREFSEKTPLVIDSRPSDAFALAVRCKCPIFIFPRVTDQAALPLDFFLDAMGDAGEISADTSISRLKGAEPERPGFVARRETLRMELDQAVAAEEYERAAELRDVLALLDKEGRNGR